MATPKARGFAHMTPVVYVFGGALLVGTCLGCVAAFRARRFDLGIAVRGRLPYD